MNYRKLFVLFVITCSACASAKPEKNSEVSAAESDVMPINSKVVASNSPTRQLHVSDYKHGLRLMSDDTIRMLRETTDDQVGEWAKKFHSQELLVDIAEKRNIEQSESFIVQLEAARRRLLIKELSKNLREEFAAQAPNLKALARERYAAHPDLFMTEELRKFAHILLSADVSNDQQQKKQQLEKAKSLLQKIESGDNFNKIAKEHSADYESAVEGGVLPGDYPRTGALVEPFAKAGFALENPGDVSKVIESKFGYHIIKLLEIKPAKLLPFEDVENAIVKTELSKYIDNKLFEFQSELTPFKDSIKLGLIKDLIKQEFNNRDLSSARKTQ